jgi:hypothetical protein
MFLQYDFKKKKYNWQIFSGLFRNNIAKYIEVKNQSCFWRFY